MNRDKPSDSCTEKVRSRHDPFFIVGDERSGTTYLSSIVNTHPQVGLAWESRLVTRLAVHYGHPRTIPASAIEEVMAILYEEKKFKAWEMDERFVREILSNLLPASFVDVARELIRTAVKRDKPAATVWGIKKGGDYLTRVQELAKWFDESLFIHIVRDGRAVFNSKRTAYHSELNKPFETHPVRAAESWIEKLTSFEHLMEECPDRTLEIRYEDLIRDISGTMGSVWAFLRVDAVEIGKHPSEEAYVPKEYRYLHSNVGRAPQLSRVDAWKNELPAKEVGQFEILAGTMLERRGYERSNCKLPPLKRVYVRAEAQLRQFVRMCRRYVRKGVRNAW